MKDLKLFKFYVCGGGAFECACMLISKEGIRTPGAGIINGYKMSNVDPWNWTQSSVGAVLDFNHFSSPSKPVFWVKKKSLSLNHLNRNHISFLGCGGEGVVAGVVGRGGVVRTCVFVRTTSGIISLSLTDLEFIKLTWMTSQQAPKISLSLHALKQNKTKTKTNAQTNQTKIL